MEDTHLCFDDFSKKFNLDPQDIRLWAVFDGHGGTEISQYCENHFPKKLIGLESFQKGDYKAAVEEIFTALDKDILEEGEKNSWKSGATAVFVLSVKDEIYIGNIGDSEAVLGTMDDNERIDFKLLSFKHKPTQAEEKTRIKESGGHLVTWIINTPLIRVPETLLVFPPLSTLIQ